MKKYTKIEGTPIVLSEHAHRVVEDTLHKMGKTSAAELSEEERRNVTDALDSTDE